MQLFISELLSAIMQVLLFSLIPFIWWLLTARIKESFFQWIGLKKFESSKGFIRILSLVILAFLLLTIGTQFLIKDIETATSEFFGLGISALPAAFIYAFITTALSEEILFRGFLLKRLSARVGFKAGNLIQAILFGLLHGVMFSGPAGIFKAIIITAFTGLIAWFLGYINEEKANGSILPSWIIHGLANLVSAIFAMFAVF